MSQALIECVPNFSEGRDPETIRSICSEIESVPGVSLLDVDPGKATNRTVVTFVGAPDVVVEAAFRAIRKASELIDMQQHQGEHPRMGATDVCPLIPIRGISMEETVQWAEKLAERVGQELRIPVYLYEQAAKQAIRQNLANIRAGEYEGLAKKLEDPSWKPDYGPAQMNLRSGATVIGARDFLIAYNVNLNTTSTRRANSVAFDLRENGRVRELDGKKVLDENGQEIREPGLLKSVKAIGWYIEEYGIAQISMNLTNIRITPLHIAFDTAVERAHARGLRVTGSELVGLVPLECMLEAGRYFLRKQRRSIGVSERELIRIAVKSLGLDELTPFDPDKKIIEYVMAPKGARRLIDMPLIGFADETASESPAPGGGSISAYIAALGAALGTMVANLSSHKKGWDDRWAFFGDWAAEGQQLKDRLMLLVDEDTNAFNKIMQSFSLPKQTDAEKAARTQAIQDATLYATEVPLQTLQAAAACLPLLSAMIQEGNPNSISDAAVGVQCVRAAAYGANLNVRINAVGLKDKERAQSLMSEADQLLQTVLTEESALMKIVDARIQ